MDTQPKEATPSPTPQGNTLEGVVEDVVFEEVKRTAPDPTSFLLPQKNTVASPMREVKTVSNFPSPDLPQTQLQEPTVATPTPEKPAQTTRGVQSLRTFRADIEKTMGETNASLVSMAAAESIRRAAVPLETPLPEPSSRKKYILVGATSVLFIVSGLVALSFIYLNEEKPPEIAEIAPAAFIAVDEEIELNTTGRSRQELMSALVLLKTQTDLPIGLVRAIYPTKKTGTTTRQTLTSQEFVSTLSTEWPALLSRTVRPEFMLGIHSFDGNQPFLILKISSFEQAFAGMLEWERVIMRDLAPFLIRQPRERTPGEGTTATTTGFLPSGFSDRTFGNRDARVFQNTAGDAQLLYSFLDRTTLIITTNESTLLEAATRLATAPRL